MLEALVIAGIVAAPLGSAALFLPARQHRHVAGAGPTARRFVLAVLGTAVLAAAAFAVLKLVSATGSNLTAGVAGLVVASVLWLPVTRRWSPRAHLCWASCTFLFVVYLAYALDWTFASHLGPASTAGGVILWVFEVFAGVLSVAYLWEICDALGTEDWRRRLTPAVAGDTTMIREVGRFPMVSLHVPAHNEPPDMVIDTLRALLRLDYPRYEVILIDDNTDDEDLWRPVEAWCASHGVKFKHLENWPGYKSGALNYALRNLIDRTGEPVLEACREHAIAWVPFFPLGSAGYGTFRTVTGDPTVTAIASELAVTPAQVALAWLLAHYDDTLLIPGTATPAHLTENIAAGSIRLPATAMAALDRLAPPGVWRG